MIRGVLALLFGLFALFNPEGASRLFITLFAIFLLIDGLINLLIAWSNRHTNSYGVFLAIGILEIVVAIATFMRPDITGTILAILIGLWLLFKGTMEIFVGFALRREMKGEWVLILAGVLAIIAGIAFLLLPFTDSVAAIWLFGLYAVTFGTLYIIFGYEIRKHSDELAKLIEEQQAEAEAAAAETG